METKQVSSGTSGRGRGEESAGMRSGWKILSLTMEMGLREMKEPEINSKKKLQGRGGWRG